MRAEPRLAARARPAASRGAGGPAAPDGGAVQRRRDQGGAARAGASSSCSRAWLGGAARCACSQAPTSTSPVAAAPPTTARCARRARASHPRRHRRARTTSGSRARCRRCRASRRRSRRSASCPHGMEEGTELDCPGAGVRPGRRRAGASSASSAPRCAPAIAPAPICSTRERRARRAVRPRRSRCRRSRDARRAGGAGARCTRASPRSARSSCGAAHASPSGAGSSSSTSAPAERPRGPSAWLTSAAATRRHRPRHDQLRVWPTSTSTTAAAPVRGAADPAARDRRAIGREPAAAVVLLLRRRASSPGRARPVRRRRRRRARRLRIGAFAREQMAALPGRVVHSAKSWLSHAGVDREAPSSRSASEEIPAELRLSPVEASSALPRATSAAAWNDRFAQRRRGRCASTRSTS